MRRRQVLISAISLAAVAAISAPVRAQELVNDEFAPLYLTRVIPIPDTEGRLDVWSHGIVVHCTAISGGTSYGTDSSRQRHDD